MNKCGGFYETGRSFTRARWISITEMYERQLQAHGSCSIRELAMIAGISRHSASKAIDFYGCGIVAPREEKQGHGLSGVGVMSGMDMRHHSFIYEQYLRNPSLPLDGYLEELERAFGLIISKNTIQRWFMTIGPFKGTMRVTSTFPNSRDSWQTYRLLQRYLAFILSISDHTRLVFADEKPMKEKMIYGKVRRDVMRGTTPSNKCKSVNSKNRYNILTAINIKGGSVQPVVFEVLPQDSKTDAPLFLQFVQSLRAIGALIKGDIFIVDCCTVHIKGDCVGLQEELFQNHGILMITLPPYHPDFNPTELVFQCLLRRLTCDRSRYNSLDATNFLDAVKIEMNNFSLDDVKSFYRKFGYYL